MKQHVVVKLRNAVADPASMPDWQTFITDKRVVREHLEPSVDEVFRRAGRRFWATREYSPADAQWSEEEVRHRLDRTYRLILQDDYGLPPSLVQEIVLLPVVEEVSRLGLAEAGLPDPELAAATSVGATPGELINLAVAKAITRGSPDVRVAVLDTGVDLEHPELRGRISDVADFVDLQGLDVTDFLGDVAGYDDIPHDEVGHGSHVAGIISGRGVAMDEGVAPECRLMAVRVLATMRKGNRICGAGIVDNINPAIKWAVDRGADVINMSLGIRHVGGGLPHADVIRYALARNVTVVAASGNDGTAERYYPGALPGVFAVGAVDGTGSIAAFSSYGAPITVVAPGVDIYSSYANGGYLRASGTSQASPYVAGACALMKSYAREQGSRLDNGQILDVLKRTSDKVDGRLRDRQAGYGVVNLADAFRQLMYSLN